MGAASKSRAITIATSSMSKNAANQSSRNFSNDASVKSNKQKLESSAFNTWASPEILKRPRKVETFPSTYKFPPQAIAQGLSTSVKGKEKRRDRTGSRYTSSSRSEAGNSEDLENPFRREEIARMRGIVGEKIKELEKGKRKTATWSLRALNLGHFR